MRLPWSTSQCPGSSNPRTASLTLSHPCNSCISKRQGISFVQNKIENEKEDSKWLKECWSKVCMYFMQHQTGKGWHFPLLNRHILVKTTASEQQSRQALNGKVDKFPKLSLTDCVTDEHKNQPTSAPSRSHLMQWCYNHLDLTGRKKSLPLSWSETKRRQKSLIPKDFSIHDVHHIFYSKTLIT